MFAQNAANFESCESPLLLLHSCRLPPNVGTRRNGEAPEQDEMLRGADVSVPCFLRHRQVVSQREQVETSPLHSVFRPRHTSAVCTSFVCLFFALRRFAMALQQFLDSLQMVKTQITPGKLTWPLTKEVVKETQPEYFKVAPPFVGTS